VCSPNTRRPAAVQRPPNGASPADSWRLCAKQWGPHSDCGAAPDPQPASSEARPISCPLLVAARIACPSRRPIGRALARAHGSGANFANFAHFQRPIRAGPLGLSLVVGRWARARRWPNCLSILRARVRPKGRDYGCFAWRACSLAAEERARQSLGGRGGATEALEGPNCAISVPDARRSAARSGQPHWRAVWAAVWAAGEWRPNGGQKLCRRRAGGGEAAVCLCVQFACYILHASPQHGRFPARAARRRGNLLT